jgi:hypothetical protein
MIPAGLASLLTIRFNILTDFARLITYQFKFAAGIASFTVVGQSASQKPASGTETAGL